MAGAKLKLLAGLLAADALVAAGIWLGVVPLLALQEWLWLNILAAAFSLAIFSGIKLQRRRKKYGEGHLGLIQTARGESVKSGGEKMIADYLHAHDIKYEYEKPAIDSFNRRISRPDFYLPDYDIYVEYWGMVNAEEKRTRKEYVRGMEWKMARYRENGLRVISVYPGDLGNLDSIFRAELK